MPIRFNEGFSIKAPFPIDDRLIVDRLSGTTASLEALTPQYNYRNMIVWVREDKAFYYLRDNPNSPSNPGITFSDWILFSGGGGATTSCTKSGYITGNSFTTNGTIATASVVFQVPYLYASYSVAVTGLTNYDITGLYDDYVYSVFNRSTTGFDIQVNVNTVPLGATAMWIASCFEGSNDIAQVLVGGGGSSSAIDLEEIAYGTGTGITSSSTFTFDVSNTSLIFGNDHTITNAISSAIIAGTDSCITSTTIGYFVESNIILASTLACINCSDFSSIQNTNCGQIWNSTQSVIINSSAGSFGSKICNSNNAAIMNAPRSCIINTSGSYENISRQFIIGGYLHIICQEEGPGPGNGYSGGSGIVGGAGNCICVGGVHSIILSGRCNLIRNLNFFDPTDSSPNSQKFSGGRSAILAGERNTLSGPKIDGSVIIGGCTNSITSGTIFSTIVGGCRNTIGTSSNSTIIGGSGNSMTASCYSTIIGSKNSCIIGGTATSIEVLNGGLGLACRSQILSGNFNRIYGSEDSFMIGSRISKICRDELAFMIGNVNSCMHNSNGISLRSDSLFATGSENIASIVSNEATFCSNICNSTMIGGSDNCIFTSVSSVIINSFDSGISGSGYSTIINSRESTVTASFFSSIISSTISCISDSNHSIILGSTSSLICNKSGISSMNSIISGNGNCIANTSGGATKNTSILGGCHNKIVSSTKAGASYNSVIIGGCGNVISSALNAVIIGGENLSLSGDVTGGGFSNVVVVPSFKGNGSFALSVTTASSDYLLDETNFTLMTYPPISGMTVSLPRAVLSYGRIYVIKKDGSSTQSVVNIYPDVSNGDTIDGYAGSIELINPWDYNILQADGVDNWIKLGGAVGLNL